MKNASLTMDSVDLRPGDVLLFPVSGYGIFNPLARLLMKYGHVALYYTETKRDLPLIIESIGRGVLIRSLYCYDGVEVTVMRPEQDGGLGERAAKAAERIADCPGSWYGYFDIPRFVLPKLILARLGALLPERVRKALFLLCHTYRHNSVYICSELVAQAYENAGCPLVEADTIPLPDDLACSPTLRLVGTVVPAGPDPDDANSEEVTV